jgi:hypothetical protein
MAKLVVVVVVVVVVKAIRWVSVAENASCYR